MERGIQSSGGKLNPDDFITVGDTPLDILAAHEIGIRIVGVATGLYKTEDLAQAEWALATVENRFPASGRPGQRRAAPDRGRQTTRIPVIAAAIEGGGAGQSRPAASARASARSVRSQVKFSLLRPKWP